MTTIIEIQDPNAVFPNIYFTVVRVDGQPVEVLWDEDERHQHVLHDDSRIEEAFTEWLDGSQQVVVGAVQVDDYDPAEQSLDDWMREQVKDFQDLLALTVVDVRAWLIGIAGSV